MDGPAHRHRHRGLRAQTLALTWAALACTQRSQERSQDGRASEGQATEVVTHDTVAAQLEPLRVAVHGCDLFVEADARRCRLNRAHRMSLWLPGPPRDDLELRVDGVALTPERIVEHEGSLLRFEIEAGHGRVELVAGDRPLWSIATSSHSPAYVELYAEIAALVEAGELEQAIAHLDAGARALDPDDAATTRCLAAQLAYGTERVAAIVDELRGGPAIGCLGTAELIVAHMNIYQQMDLNAAQRSIDAAAKIGEQNFGIHVNALLHQADLNLLVGRVDESIELFDRVIRLAPLTGELNVVRSAQVMKTIALARLGRYAEADALSAELEATLGQTEAPDEVTLDIRYNMAWAALLRREDDPEVADPRATLEQLLASYRERGDTRSAARTQLHLALAAEQSGELERAELALADVDRSALAPFELVWLELIGSRVALARNELTRAGELLERATAFAELSEDLELTWLLTTARARLARAKRDLPTALASYEHAAVLADQLALSVPGTAGRSMLVTTHGRADAEHVELLLELAARAPRAKASEHVERALCVAAGSRARHLRALWARLRPPLSDADQRAYHALLSQYEARRKTIDAALEQAWSLSAEQLAELRERLQRDGEHADALLAQATALLEREAPSWSCAQVLPRRSERAVLTMIRDPGRETQRWWFMLARADQPTRVVELELQVGERPEALADAALRQFSDALAGVEVLTVIPVGAFVGVDMQRLALAHPSLATLELRYSLGLGRAEETQVEADALPRSAAVVAGASDLAAVSQEAARVGEALREHAWAVTPDWSPSGAQPTLLHYSGHGHHSGLAGWRSYFEVPGVGRVSAAQIVAAQRAPNFVVLGACSAGSTDAEIIDGGMNLAAAFLLAGASLVIAPSGPVDDDAALSLAGELYRKFDHARLDGLSHALVDRQRLEFAAGEAVPEDRSYFRWRAWVP